MNFLKFTHDKLSVDDISDLVRSNSCGAIYLFVETSKITAWDNEIFYKDESRGLRHFEKICKDIREEWTSVENIAIYYRLGEVPVKEASIVIAISSPHRNDAVGAIEMCVNAVETPPIRVTAVTEKLKIKEETEEEEYLPEEKKEILRPTIVTFKLLDYSVEKPKLFSTQIKTSREEIDKRIEKCMQIKRNDLNMMNIREFCGCDVDANTSCARAVAVFQKRKDSKSYLEVHKVLNNYQYRDTTTSEAFEKFIPRNGIEERLESLESQLSLTTPVDDIIYDRIKLIEDRILKLESLSPEYIDLWERLAVTSTARTKRRFTMEEIDEMIAALEKKRKDSEEQS